MFRWLFPTAARRANNKKTALAWLSHAEAYLRLRYANKPGVQIERITVPETDYYGHIRVHCNDEVVLQVYAKDEKYYVCFVETLLPKLAFPLKQGVRLDPFYDPVYEIKRVIPRIPALYED